MINVKSTLRLQLIYAVVLIFFSSMSYAVTPDALRQAHYQRCSKPVFYAQTANHKKEVEICVVAPSISYSFGKVGSQKKEMAITVPAASTIYAYQSNQVISIQEFTITKGDTSYQISSGTNDSGEPLAFLYVYQGDPESGKLLAVIKLDPSTVSNNINHSLAQVGVKQADNL